MIDDTDILFVRHVHGFLEEIGQGVQHIASRVDDLPAFVQRGNDYREITGEVRSAIKRFVTAMFIILISFFFLTGIYISQNTEELLWHPN